MSTSASKTATKANPWRRYKVTDDEFDQMVRAGILREGSHAFSTSSPRPEKVRIPC